jgi:hypothetical protein
MRIRIAFSLLTIALAAIAASARGDEKASVNVQRLEALKRLAGDWVQVGADGKPTDKVISSIRVTSAGNTVQETIFPGGDHEMVTMYHLDGANLMLTHYCALGNQPRMRAEPEGDINRIAFKFVDGTNLKASDNHMHEATLTIVGNDHIKTEWVACKDGTPCHKVGFDLVRKAK